jgi:hypothetical protein
MMKKIINIRSITLIIAAMSLIGCSDDFLEKSPVGSLSVKDLEGTAEIRPEILESTLKGLFTMMYTPGTGGYGGHNDFGQKSHDIHTDILSGDVALSKNTYSRYAGLANLIQTLDYTVTATNYPAWRYYYRLIRSCNLVIDASGGNDAPITDANRISMGQAKGLRGYAYFYLAQLFIQEYSETSTILPIYTDSSNPANQPQSTTKEVYDLIISDLTASASLLANYNRAQKYELNKDVAKSLLAYAYGAIGTSAANIKARDLAEEVISAGYPLTTMAESTGGFNNVNTPSWIWGVDITTESGKHLHSWWGQMDYYSYSYLPFGDIKSIDDGLFAQIKSTDIRKTQFLDSPTSQFNLISWWKFYHPDRVKYGTSVYTDADYIYLRTEEMYLLSAEMNAREGNDAPARNRLKNILALRFTNAADYAYIDALSGQALQDEVYLQTRIELWGEGKSYLAMKRNKATITRGSNHVFHASSSYLYNSDELTLEIPQSEIQNNPFINRN